jgi:hypothetical protein
MRSSSIAGAVIGIGHATKSVVAEGSEVAARRILWREYA